MNTLQRYSKQVGIVINLRKKYDLILERETKKRDGLLLTHDIAMIKQQLKSAQSRRASRQEGSSELTKKVRNV